MPIFYKHIKGCGVSTIGTSTSTTDLWTYLVWRDTGDMVNKVAIGAPSSAHFNYAPSIKVAASQSGDQYDLGRIITSDATEQYINKAFTFKDNVIVGKNLYFNKSSSGVYMQAEDNNVFKFAFGGGYIQAYSGGVYFNADVYLSKNISVTEKAQLHRGLYVGTKLLDYPASNGVIKADDKCEALYFNATSDRRAKSNITPLSASALSIVKSLPIYTFNYTSKPEETTIGLIAQEAAEHDLDNFNMVDNLDASGENNDFMQMKESKLVYVLWKAVQELSAEVESLKEQLNSK